MSREFDIPLLDKDSLLYYIHNMKNRVIVLAGLIFCALFSQPLHADAVWGARFPAASPDGSKLSFSYYGDIWIVNAAGGKAERLTVSDGYESVSYWSPDGKWIAFQTNRWGNSDICIMPVDGSKPPKRLTYYSTNDGLQGWSPDSRFVIFASIRHTLRYALYRVSIDGGLPQPIVDFTAWNTHFLPDGRTFYFSRRGASWWRRRFRGGADSEIWKKMLPDGQSIRITNSPGRDAHPMSSAIDDKLYFLSNRGEHLANNLWRMDPDGTAAEQVTFETEDIHFPTISSDGMLIVYELFGHLYAYHITERTSKKIPIDVSEDFKENPYSFATYSGAVSEFALSPKEDELAFVVHGEIFVMQLEDGKETGKVRKITNTPYIEKHISWHPEKELLIFSSMEDGDMDIYTIEPKSEAKLHEDLLFKTKKIIDSDETEVKPRFSPDGTKIAFLKHQRTLFVADRDGKNSIQLCKDNDVLWIDWSPDSRWIAFSRTVLGWREDIFVVPVDGSIEPINISNHPNDDYEPMWSSDGRRIAYASRNATGDLWLKYVFLRKEDEEKDEEFWEDAESDSAAAPGVVAITFQDIEERIHTVTKVSGYYYRWTQSADGRQLAVHSVTQGKHDIWTVDWRGKELKRITHNDVHPKQFFITRDRKTIFYLTDNGSMYHADIASAQSTPHHFAAELEIDTHEEREQVFNEAWWALQDGFYDSDFHGINWREMYTKYKAYALQMRTIQEFHSVISQMMGELNASHLGIWKHNREQETTGALGIVPDTDYSGDGVRIKTIIRDTPASEDKVGLANGDIIVAINDVRIDKGKNFYSLLRNKNDEEIVLTVRSDAGERMTKITPTSPRKILNQIDENWVKSNQDFVHKTSDNRLGYLYIAGMGDENLKKFLTDLYKEMDKEGLIIDIRYNGGGHIHDELLTILRRTEPYAYSVGRDEEKQYSSHFRYDKPTVILINESCYSDAEIFPAAFKELKLGKLIGVPTFGAVIGTNDITLMDGSHFRIPGTGWYRMSGKNLENIPVEPDIYVDNSPEMDGASNDNQLKKAIETLLEEVE
jgi:tricorn protease